MITEKKIEKIKIDSKVDRICSRIIDLILSEIEDCSGKYVISVAGESGAGKTFLTKILVEKFLKRGIKSISICQDDYFYYPPIMNEKRRKADIRNVGSSEVNFPLLKEHIEKFLAGAKEIVKPLMVVPRTENRFTKETIKIEGVKVLIVEGTYTSLLEGVSKRIFLDRNYKKTWKVLEMERREKRENIPLLKRVLRHEHKIIKTHKRKANIVITVNFKVKPVEKKEIFSLGRF